MPAAVQSAPSKKNGAKPRTKQTFPVYPKLVNTLADPKTKQPDRVVARTLATAAMYAYSDDESQLETAMTRLGLGAKCTCTRFQELVDAMLIWSTAFLIQSEDKRVAIIDYRGTTPTSVINWVTDLDARGDRIRLRKLPDAGSLHEGFYRNVRATKYSLGEALKQAQKDGMEALYITGHSLGAAMATVMGFLLATDEDPDLQAIFRQCARGIYTFGGPMVGDKEFAATAEAELDGRLFRYRYRKDIVNGLPPRDARLKFAHFGPEYNLVDGWTTEVGKSTKQLASVLALGEGLVSFLSVQIRGLGWLPQRVSWYDHLPANYVSELTEPGELTVFGDEGRV
jgi:hypothetical protein